MINTTMTYSGPRIVSPINRSNSPNPAPTFGRVILEDSDDRKVLGRALKKQDGYRYAVDADGEGATVQVFQNGQRSPSAEAALAQSLKDRGFIVEIPKRERDLPPIGRE